MGRPRNPHTASTSIPNARRSPDVNGLGEDGGDVRGYGNTQTSNGHANSTQGRNEGMRQSPDTARGASTPAQGTLGGGSSVPTRQSTPTVATPATPPTPVTTSTPEAHEESPARRAWTVGDITFGTPPPLSPILDAMPSTGRPNAPAKEKDPRQSTSTGFARHNDHPTYPPRRLEGSSHDGDEFRRSRKGPQERVANSSGGNSRRSEVGHGNTVELVIVNRDHLAREACLGQRIQIRLARQRPPLLRPARKRQASTQRSQARTSPGTRGACCDV